ncbi:MAG: hypothetical protein K0Q94_3493 [Paenibacillus sp.]|uniref:nucleotidyltransferase domain-containing protein n=1 Tax=Paenibacillus sp. GCM10012303 TaxID=3317340 RepID=UPI0029EA4E04|nr:hypothetical protein [Paenibacillus sp.]
MGSKFKLKRSSMSQELKLLLSIVGMEHAPDLPGHILRTSASIDWDQFIELTRHHRVYPLVYSNVSRLGKELLPQHVVQVLQQDYTNNTFQMLRLSAEMQMIGIKLDKSEIPYLLVKGPLLAERLYGDISLRTCKDLDILVADQDLERAGAVLRDAGYFAADADPATILTETREHHHSYIHPNKKIQIELHWRLNWKTWSEPTFDELWARKRTFSFKGVSVHSFGPEDLFLSLTTHGARHGWSRLRWLSDIDKLMAEELDWSRIVQHLEAYRLQHIGAQALLLTSRLFGTQTGDRLPALQPTRHSYRLAKLAIEYIQGRRTHQYSISLVKGMAKLKYFIHMLQPKAYDMEMFPLPKGLRFLYVPLRPLLYIRRRFMKRQGLTREM